MLLGVARQVVETAVAQGEPPEVRIADYEEGLRVVRATFITLNTERGLRGCIGTLQAVRPVVEDVAHNAYAAAFQDPRFPPVGAGEVAGLHYHISVLSEAEPMRFTSEADLVAQLRPGEDGLILADGYHRGTFLPSVWETLPVAADFLRQLKRKAGLPADYWSDTLRVERYTTESWGVAPG